MAERNSDVVCPFCGCLYDHAELVAIYDEAERGTISKDAVLEKMADFRERVLARAGNAEPRTA